jgi:NAD-dependent oxidoreductase involved in siderophore biosynthesis
MAEFERRMTLARAKNAGKADAYAAGLLSLEEAYSFRTWSSYQIALVRAIEQTGFPESLTWPAEPATFEAASTAAMTVLDARMAVALGHTTGKADAYAAGELSASEAQVFRAWSAYQDALKRVIAKTGFPDAIAWPVAPDSTTV